VHCELPHWVQGRAPAVNASVNYTILSVSTVKCQPQTESSQHLSKTTAVKSLL